MLLLFQVITFDFSTLHIVVVSLMYSFPIFAAIFSCESTYKIKEGKKGTFNCQNNFIVATFPLFRSNFNCHNHRHPLEERKHKNQRQMTKFEGKEICFFRSKRYATSLSLELRPELHRYKQQPSVRV